MNINLLFAANVQEDVKKLSNVYDLPVVVMSPPG